MGWTFLAEDSRCAGFQYRLQNAWHLFRNFKDDNLLNITLVVIDDAEEVPMFACPGEPNTNRGQNS